MLLASRVEPVREAETSQPYVSRMSKQTGNLNILQYYRPPRPVTVGMTLDAKLQWKEHIEKKRDELNIKFRKMYWLLGYNSELSIHNKFLL
jgi:hypothetical protein